MMKFCNAKISSLFIFIWVAAATIAQDSLAPEPTLETPYNTIYTHLYYLQDDSYQPEIAARVIPPGKSPEQAQELAIQIKQILDGKGLFVRLNELPQEKDYQDTVTNENYYTPFPTLMPEIYLERINNKWYYSRETIEIIPSLHRKVFPLGADVLSRILPTGSDIIIIGLALWQFLGILLVILVCWLIHLVLSRLLRPLIRLLTGWQKRWKFISKESAHRLAKYISFFILVRTAHIMIPALQLPIKASEIANKTLYILTVIALTLIALRVLYVLVERGKEVADRTANRTDEQVLPVVSGILRIAVILIASFYILRSLGVNVAALIAGLSIGALALALAAQDTVKNLIASLMIFMDRPFQVDDYIIGDGFEGTVLETGFRSTRILTIDTSVISVPNGSIANMSITNLGVRTFRMFNTMLAITYNTPPEKIESFLNGLQEIIKEHQRTNKENFLVNLRELSDSSINILFRCYLDVPSYAEELAQREDIYLKIIRLAHSLGVEFAFPTTTVYLAGQDQEDSAP